MRIKTEIQAAIGALLLVQIITSFGAIALLSRMAPAIEEILEENVYSIDAAEDMLVILATVRIRGPFEPEHEDWKDFEAALERTRANVTEPAEPLVIEVISASYRPALGGESEALLTTIDALRQLAHINRQTMIRRDEQAKALGIAGAWAAVFLGFGGFALSVVIVVRLTRRVVAPFRELHATVTGFQRGDLYRRSRTGAFPLEFEEVARVLNTLLDEYQVRRSQGGGPTIQGLDRSALLHMIDRAPTPTLVYDCAGKLIASNRAALDLDATPQDVYLSQAAELVASGAPTPTPGFRFHALADEGWLCEIDLEALDGKAAKAGTPEPEVG
ncbi:MAG: hypothetical protein H0U74_13150 [Bradymonadaceae bacterium]|nr:hypothetical protein [Lujinxingiaceae bacterium]